MEWALRSRSLCDPADDDNSQNTVDIGARALCYGAEFVGTAAGAVEREQFRPVTPLVLENFAIIDERDDASIETHDYDQVPDWQRLPRPALDLAGTQVTQIQDVVLEQRQSPRPARPRTGVRMFLPHPDTSGYFNRIERCRFVGWDRAVVNGPGSNTMVIRDSEFLVPGGGVGVVARVAAHRVNGCSFEGMAAGDPVGHGIELHGARQLSVRGNVFTNLRIPVGVLGAFRTAPQLRRGAVSGSANNLVEQTVGGAVPPELVQYLEVPGASLGTITSVDAVTKALWLQDDDVGSPRPTASIGGENLLANVGFAEVEPFAWVAANRARLTWPIVNGGWWGRVVDSAVDRQDDVHLLLDPQQHLGVVADEVEGPAGPSLAPARRIWLGEAPPPEVQRDYYLWQFVCPPTSGTSWDAYLSRATRLTGRALSMSVWVRTNLRRQYRVVPGPDGSATNQGDWSSGVMAGIWRRSTYANNAPRAFNDHSGRVALGRTGVHSGLERWELLTGVGWVPGGELATSPSAGAGGHAIRFAIRIARTSDSVADGGGDAYVDVCTPTVTTAMFPGLPVTPRVHEDGGDLFGPVMPQLGSTTTMTLFTTVGLQGLALRVMRAPRHWRLVSATAVGTDLSDAGRVSVRATAGAGEPVTVLAERNLDAFIGSPAAMPVLSADVPRGHYVEVSSSTNALVSVLLRFAPRDGDEASRTLGY